MKVVVLTGGIGGAKLVLGLTRIVPAADLTAVVNTGDDFRHLGLPVSPDVDTLLYTLSGRNDTERGWGRAGETWNFMAALGSLGGPDWFNLGDGDLALHVLRLSLGLPLSQSTARFAQAWALGLAILPMSDDPVATMVETDEGTLGFQDYFVGRRCAPAVRAVRFEGADTAHPAPGVLAAIAAADAIVIAPSNPWLSVDPILAIPQIRAALEQARAPIVAVSPIVGGTAVKGPTAKIMGELGLEVTNAAIAEHYAGLIDALLIDSDDPAPGADAPGRRGPLAHGRTPTLMTTLADRERVAEAALALARTIGRGA